MSGCFRMNLGSILGLEVSIMGICVVMGALACPTGDGYTPTTIFPDFCRLMYLYSMGHTRTPHDYTGIVKVLRVLRVVLIFVV
jgi:hypothetical protein